VTLVKQFFQDNKGKYSMMRLMNLASLAAAVWFGYLYMTGASNGLELVTLFMVGAFAPKAIQKATEKGD
jgi:hypothetical protein